MVVTMAVEDEVRANLEEVSVSELLSLQEAVGLLPRVSVHTLRRWAKANRVSHIELPGGRLWFRREDILALMTPVQVDPDGSK